MDKLQGVIGSMTQARGAMLRHYISRELAAHTAARAKGDMEGAWSALERAHILAQPLLGHHLRVHAAMLSLALVTRDRREAIGQLLRLVLAPLGTLTGRLPWGNSGRANVSAFKPSAIPDDLRDLLIAAGVTAAASDPKHGD